MSTVFLVMGNNDYEPGGPIHAFAEKALADQFVAKWKQHQQRKPEPPEVIEDTPENDALHDRWWQRLERWHARCPGGSSACSYSDVSIHSMKVITKEIRA